MATRAKPLLPKDTEEPDMEKETREEKLENYLKDFDIEVEARICDIEKKCVSMCKSIRSATSMYLMKMPKNMKNMKMVDYFAQDGVTQSVKVIQEISKTVDEITQSVAHVMSSSSSELETTASSSAVESEAAAASSVSSATESEVDEEEVTDTKPKRSARSTRKATASRKKAASTAKRTSARKRTRAVLQETPANRENTRSVEQTPANTVSLSSMSTPFITPKFDPRSKLTPATVRRAKKGELLVSLSGSPVEAKNSPKDPIQKVEMLKENIETLFNEDKVDRENILLLQETLSKLLKGTS